MPNWDIDQALNQTENNIIQGSTLPIKPTALAELRDNIDDNYIQQKAKGADWADDDDWVLTLARMVGSVAAYLALEKSLTEVGLAELEAAIRVVASMVCPMTTGGYCEYYSDVADLPSPAEEGYRDALGLMGYQVEGV